MVDVYENEPGFIAARDTHNLCALYATAYTQTMLQRLSREQPEFFEEQGISLNELAAHLSNNMCLP